MDAVFIFGWQSASMALDDSPVGERGAEGLSPNGHLEVERKYEIAPDGELPDLLAGPVTRSSRARTLELRATYYDTEDLALLGAGVTLRRRTGGEDDGWHVKLPVDADTRREIGRPLGRGRQVPADVAGLVTTVTYARPLVPVVDLHTTRVVRTLRDATGTNLAEVADDTVAARRMLPTPQSQTWREVEVELIDGDVEVLDAIEERLVAAGIARSDVVSKLRRAVGDGVPQAPLNGTRRALLPKKSGGAALYAYLAQHRDRLVAADLAVRTEDASVHQIRVTARRLRSAVAVYRPLLDAERARHLQDELKWLGQVLSEVRDAEVVRKRLDTVLGEGGARVDPATAAHVERRLTATARPARAAADEAMRSARYGELLSELNALLRDPHWTADARRDADDVLERRVAGSLSRLRKRARAAAKAAPEDRLSVLHEVRKSAKRLRYAIEVAEPALGKQATQLLAGAEDVQSALGELLDAHHLREWADRLGHDRVGAVSAFDLGALHARQTEALSSLERAAVRAVDRLLDSKAAKAFG